jgi:hypothetical protein
MMGCGSRSSAIFALISSTKPFTYFASME